MTEPEDSTSPSGERPPASPASTPPPPEVPPAEGGGDDETSQGIEATESLVTGTLGAAPDPAIPTPGAVAPPVEPVVPPAPQVRADTPAPAPPPEAPPPPTKSAPVDYEEPDDADDEDEDDLEPIPRWVSLVNTMGVGLVAVVTAQVITAIVQGFTYKADEPQGVTSDLLHRLGFPFTGNTWILALVAVLVGVLLISLPVLLDQDTTFGQERMALLALGVTVAVAIIICLGAILAVRSNLHIVTASGRDVPGYYRVDLTTFLLGTLGTGVLAIYGAVVTRSLRSGRD